MRLRKLATGAALTLNLAVLVATSPNKGQGTGTTGPTGPAPTTEPSTTTNAEVLTASDGPYSFALDAGTRTAEFDAELVVTQELLDRGTVDLVVHITGEHSLTEEASLELLDYAYAGDPDPASAVPFLTLSAAEGPGPQAIDLTVEVRIEEAGVHHLVLSLGGAEELAGELLFGLEATIAEPPAGAELSIEIL